MDLAALLLRLSIGLILLLHGLNHARGGIAGVAGWFDSIGLRPGRLHAWLATVTEIAVGTLLIAGLLTSLSAAGSIGLMAVALVTTHLHNGFFIFNEGQGYEYVVQLMVASAALAALGGGTISVDALFGIGFSGWQGLGVGVLLGMGGAGILLLSCWRRPVRSADA